MKDFPFVSKLHIDTSNPEEGEGAVGVGFFSFLSFLLLLTKPTLIGV